MRPLFHPLTRSVDRRLDRAGARPLAAIALVAGLLAACGPKDPQLAMCQELANKLVGDIAGFDDAEQQDGARARDIDITYTTNADAGGTIACRYPIDKTTGAVATAPDQVILDGRRLSTRELFSAGTKASGKLIADTADATADRTRELAGDAGDMARDVADKALESTIEGAQALREKLER